MDNELKVLHSIETTAELTQRDIASRTGLSLGTINILLKKMIREGLIKLETIPPKRLAYMLTPKGMEEKAKKVGTYIQAHYRAIQHMRLQLEWILEPCLTDDHTVVLSIKQVELQSLVKQVLQEKGKQYSVISEGLDLFGKTIMSDEKCPDDLPSDAIWINVMDALTV